MKAETSPVSQKIARTRSAAKAGLLGTYAPARSISAKDMTAQMSWGPAMRR